jgi:hypothetical protein
MYWISAGNINAITYTGETYEKSYTVYNSVTSSCLYAAKESNVSNIYLLSLEESSASAASITLPQSLVIQHMTSAGSYAYVSGHKSSNADTTYTTAIDLRNNRTISLSVPGYLTSSVADGTRLIASTSTNALVVIECEQVLTIEGVEVSGVYSSDGNILC